MSWRRSWPPRPSPARPDQPSLIRAISASSLLRPAAISSAAPPRDDRLPGPLQEDVGDLDLLRPSGLGDRQRVDGLLDLVASRELGRLAAVDPVGLVVDDQRRAPVRFDQQVDRAAQDGVGDLDRSGTSARLRSAPRTRSAKKPESSQALNGASSASSVRPGSPASAEVEMRRTSSADGARHPLAWLHSSSEWTALPRAAPSVRSCLVLAVARFPKRPVAGRQRALVEALAAADIAV